MLTGEASFAVDDNDDEQSSSDDGENSDGPTISNLDHVRKEDGGQLGCMSH